MYTLQQRTEQKKTRLPGQRMQLHSQMNSVITFIYDSWDQVTVAASSESEDSEFVPLGSDIILSANPQNFVHVTGETLIR